MSVDDPPNSYFNGIGYNSLFYVKDTKGLTKANGDTYYFSKVNSDISNAPLTTFNGATILSGTTTITDGVLFNTRQIKSTTLASNAHQLFDNMTTAGVLTIGNVLSTNTINGATIFNQNNIQYYQ